MHVCSVFIKEEVEIHHLKVIPNFKDIKKMEKGRQSCDDYANKWFSPKEIYEELISNNGSVPQAFVRLDQGEGHSNASTHPSPLSLPVMDLRGSGSATNLDNIKGESRRDVVERLHSACKDWGFFLVVNHGVDEHALEKLKIEISEFFNLGLEEKMKYKVRAGEAEGYGQNQISPLQEQSRDHELDWADRFYMITNPVSLRKPHLFPMLPPSLRGGLEAYLEQVEELATKLMLWMCEALGMERGEVEELFDDGMRSVRMTYYPPYPNPEQVVGITPHSDATLVTVLHQLNGVGGLEVSKDGRWIPVHVPPHALLVNVGDLMEVLSNGAYESVEHRVSVNPEKERMSIAVFFNPKLEAQLGPSRSLITPSNPPLFRTLAMNQYVHEYFTTKLDGKSYLDKMRI